MLGKSQQPADYKLVAKSADESTSSYTDWIRASHALRKQASQKHVKQSQAIESQTPYKVQVRRLELTLCSKQPQLSEKRTVHLC